MPSRWPVAATLAALVTLSAGVVHGQRDTTMYVEFTYMKSTSQDYVDIERDFWKPIHEARIAAGELQAWTLYAARFGERTEYDYVVVNVYRGLDAFESAFANVQTLAQQVHPNRDIDAESARTMAARTTVKSELWQVVSAADGSDWSAPTLGMTYMRVNPGQEAEYIALERDLWKPMQEERIRRGDLAGWIVYQLWTPGGTDYPYRFAAAVSWTGWDFGPSTADVAAVVHPDLTWTDISERTQSAREGARFEVWRVVEHIEASR